jgi:hypothetical protein
MQDSHVSNRRTSRGKYTRLQQIGSGSYGKVFTIREEESGMVFVSKKIDLNYVDVS